MDYFHASSHGMIGQLKQYNQNWTCSLAPSTTIQKGCNKAGKNGDRMCVVGQAV